MIPSAYQAAAQRTECDQLKARTRMYGVRPYVPEELDLLAPIRLNHAVVGMMGEVGEIAQLLEKWVYYGKPPEVEKIAEETGDLLWYVAELCNALGLDLGRIMEANIAKLKVRYPEKYADELADRANRNTEAERKAVEAANGGPNPLKPQPFSSLHSSAHVPQAAPLVSPTPKFFTGKEVKCGHCRGSGMVGFSVGDEWSNGGKCGMCGGRGLVEEGSVGATCSPATSLRPVDRDLGQRFLDVGVDPKTVDGEEDIHQVAPPTPGIGRFQEPPTYHMGRNPPQDHPNPFGYNEDGLGG